MDTILNFIWSYQYFNAIMASYALKVIHHIAQINSFQQNINPNIQL